MARKMSLAREIRIQKMQTKNRMTGQTFNPSGITSEQIKDRERTFVEYWENKPIEERITYWSNVQEVISELKSAGFKYFSWEWEWCAFKRNFIIDSKIV